MLMATYPILYRSVQYKIGDTLPANDQEMVKAWLDANTATWESEEENQAEAVQSTLKSEQVEADNESKEEEAEPDSTTPESEQAETEKDSEKKQTGKKR